ncbi:acyl carrier protein [Pseudonocardia alaniniphila]|uniref:Acyl carrier protein n=1 Tax=Pseudonocardia alaniniphila TaxID=75291 RepID=A0ABS9TTT9_9PSEU|nr:acyl carrier protein [Pseudonocardia alaniniphila]MCH6171911.1 acyl carrier protein [Pseudonocardia alaniniphila]
MEGSLAECVKAVVAQQLGVEEDEVAVDSSFADLGADELDLQELMMAFEERFDVQIPDEVAEELTTVQAVVNYIEEH